MCYAIPGKVEKIEGKIINVSYFGEIRKAKNEFFDLRPGQYIYAQGGFVVQIVEEKEALNILQNWKEIFVQLKATDLRLAGETNTLHKMANSVRQKHLGNSCCVHGILEFSNYCTKDCAYCGIRKSNKKAVRYRMSVDEIVERCDYVVNKLGFKAVVFQSGEDLWYTEEKLIEMVRRIRKKCAILVILSIGERPLSTYQKLYDEGARSALLRFETSNSKIFEKIKPGAKLEDRVNLIKELGKMGYLVMTGFLVGLPGQTDQDLINDIRLTGDLQTEMFSFGPFIPHRETPLAGCERPTLESALNAIARARLLYPEAKILATTALETLDKQNGARQALLAGANSIMVNLTPKKYQKLYEIYPDRKGDEQEIKERITEVLELMSSIGRAPSDLGLN